MSGHWVMLGHCLNLIGQGEAQVTSKLDEQQMSRTLNIVEYMGTLRVLLWPRIYSQYFGHSDVE